MRIVVNLFFLLLFYSAFSQKSYFGKSPHEWTSTPIIPKTIDLGEFSNDDLVILDEENEFSFYSSKDQVLKERIVLLINNETGLSKFNKLQLPESYDVPHDENYYEQGRKSKIKVPFIAKFNIINFTARKYKFNRWEPLNFKYNAKKIRWIKPSGEYLDDYIHEFYFEELKAGDVVELFYEIDFSSTYGSNLFYPNGKISKLNSSFKFNYKVGNNFKDYSFILPVSINDSLIKTTYTTSKETCFFTKQFNFSALKSISHPKNALISKQFPYIYADFRFYRVIRGSYSDGSNRVYEYDLIRTKNFEWLIIKDTTNGYEKIYDKQYASVRKYLAGLPATDSDSGKVEFVKALCNSFNSLNYINSNDLYYNKSDKYNLYSGDHLLKGRLVEHLTWKLTKDILNEKGIMYYIVNIQDNRYGEHNFMYRSNYAYENYFIALPNKGKFIYFIPRMSGVRYYLNELPFYYEGSLAAMYARNFQHSDTNKVNSYFKLIRTHKGTSNENTKVENGVVNIKRDSLKADLSIKTSLSGQFSTILRHYYNNTYIDSTLPTFYFKRSTDKGNKLSNNNKLTSKMEEYPFRANYVGATSIKLDSKEVLTLDNWFSFPLDIDGLTIKPNHDYYIDFESTDAYNFVLKFDSPTKIINSNEFKKSIDTDNFSFSSDIVTQNESTYLLKIELKIKKREIKMDKINEFIELVDLLRKYGNIKLQLA
ncbi:MAG: hypothetical protein AB7O73_09505 [Bacteroidia bacterium]